MLEQLKMKIQQIVEYKLHQWLGLKPKPDPVIYQIVVGIQDQDLSTKVGFGVYMATVWFFQ